MSEITLHIGIRIRKKPKLELILAAEPRFRSLVGGNDKRRSVCAETAAWAVIPVQTPPFPCRPLRVETAVREMGEKRFTRH